MKEQDTRRGIFGKAGQFVRKAAGMAVAGGAIETLHKTGVLDTYCGGIDLRPRVARAEVKRRGPINFAVPGGWHYTEALTDDDDEFYPAGYTVATDLHEHFLGEGGLQVLGEPHSREAVDKQGFRRQLFKHAMLQKNPDGSVEWAPVLDWFTEKGWDDWLYEQHRIPHVAVMPKKESIMETVNRQRWELLDQASAIKEKFESNPNWERQYGFPTGVEDFGDEITLRCQRAAIRYSKADETVRMANLAAIVKAEPWRTLELPGFGARILTMDITPNYEQYVSIYTAPDDGIRLPESIYGSEIFKQQVIRALEYMAQKAPEFYARFIQNVYYIEDSGRGTSNARIGVRGIMLRSITREQNELELQQFVTSLAHEEEHIDLYHSRLQSGGWWGEFASTVRERYIARQMNAQWLIERREAYIRDFHNTERWWRQTLV